MGKLIAIGAALLGLGGTPAVTVHEARQALWIDIHPGVQVSCVRDGLAQDCTISASAEYTDPVIGPAIATNSTTFRVTRHGHGYRIRRIVPNQVNIWAR